MAFGSISYTLRSQSFLYDFLEYHLFLKGNNYKSLPGGAASTKPLIYSFMPFFDILLANEVI